MLSALIVFAMAFGEEENLAAAGRTFYVDSAGGDDAT